MWPAESSLPTPVMMTERLVLVSAHYLMLLRHEKTDRASKCALKLQQSLLYWQLFIVQLIVAHQLSINIHQQCGSTHYQTAQQTTGQTTHITYSVITCIQNNVGQYCQLCQPIQNFKYS